MPRQRTHNEYFTTVSYGGRKSCINCREKFPTGEQQWTWGEYHHGAWRTVARFCVNCFEKEVKIPLLAHLGPCGCKVNLVFKWATQPEWLTLDEVK